MFKNNFFKKVTSCCLTLAGVLSLSMPCNAKWINRDEFNSIFNDIFKFKTKYKEIQKNNDICACKFITSKEKEISVFYISYEHLKDYFDNYCNYQNINSYFSEISTHKIDSIFIIRDKITNNSIESKINSHPTAYFIYESEINNFLGTSQKQTLFEFLGFKSRTYNPKPISKSEVFMLLGILSLIVATEIVGVVNKVIKHLR